MKTKLLTIVFMLSLPLMAQERAALQGRVTVADAYAPGIFVINKNTGTEVKTDAQGLFTVSAKNGDKLVVYSNKTVVREFHISPDSFNNTPYVLEVEPQGYDVEEVVINKTLTAETLGLVPKGQKRPTVAERRLRTAAGTQPLWVYALGLLAGSMPVDPFINAINGRTKMLKKELATEKRLAIIDKISGLYTDAELTATLLIPAEKAQGFLYYAADDAKLTNAFANNNDTDARLLLAALAGSYLTLQQQPDSTGALQNQQPTQPTNED